MAAVAPSVTALGLAEQLMVGGEVTGAALTVMDVVADAVSP
jgi:hypothetical protein